MLLALIITFGVIFLIARASKSGPEDDPSAVTVKARLIKKEYNQITMNGGEHYLTYELETGKTVRLHVRDSAAYRAAEENKWVMLTYVGYDFIRFEIPSDLENDGESPAPDTTPEKAVPSIDSTDDTAPVIEDEFPPSAKPDDEDYVEGLKELRKSGLLTEEEYRDMIDKHKK